MKLTPLHLGLGALALFALARKPTPAPPPLKTEMGPPPPRKKKKELPPTVAPASQAEVKEAEAQYQKTQLLIRQLTETQAWLDRLYADSPLIFDAGNNDQLDKAYFALIARRDKIKKMMQGKKYGEIPAITHQEYDEILAALKIYNPHN